MASCENSLSFHFRPGTTRSTRTPRRAAEVLDDRGMIDVRVLDEDRSLRLRDALQEDLADLIWLIVGLVGAQADLADRNAARRTRPADDRGLSVVVSPVQHPALAEV